MQENQVLGCSSLASSVKAQDLGAVRRLLSNGSDPDSLDSQGAPVMLRAAFDGNLDIVEALVCAGALVDCVELSNRLTPLGVAASKGHLDIVKHLIGHGANPNPSDRHAIPLNQAAIFGHLPTVEYLINAGADVNGVDAYGLCPLTGASEYGYVAVVRLLLDKGALPDGPKDCETTPLFHAVAKRHCDIVRLLVTAGANLQAIDAYGNSLMDFAAITGDREIISIVSAV